MKVALLLCDHVQDELRSHFGDYPELYAQWLPWAEFSVFDATQWEFPQVHEYEFYLVGGSKHSVYDQQEWIQPLKNIIQEIQQLNKKYVGICFGHQILAEALGGQVNIHEEGWSVGVHTFAMLQSASFMNPIQDSFKVSMSCRDQVQQLPPGAKLMATAPTCKIGVFLLGNMLGIQGHPEFSIPYMRELLNQRESLIGRTKVESARQSLGEGTDATILSDWIKAFFSGS